MQNINKYFSLLAVARATWYYVQKNANTVINTPLRNVIQRMNYSSLTLTRCNPIPNVNLILHPKINQIANNIQCRNVTKFSLKSGKRKSVKAVRERFYRLNWGIWIRTKVGKNKKLWKKSSGRKRRLRQHVFCNATQSKMLDKMVGHYWRQPKYFVDDPYEPYHTRDEFMFTRKIPRPYIPSD